METQTKRKIEVFTAGCSVCSPVVDMVKSMACSVSHRPTHLSM